MSAPLFSWGLYPAAPQTAHGCTWKNEVPQQLDCLNSEFGSTLAYGNGRSYGDSCLADSDHVLHMRTLNRFIEVDWQRGVVTAEAGITLAEILAVAIPRGWFLPVTPGTQFATLGGAIANDVHGKNHHVRGTFGNHVRRLGLQRHDQDLLTCSPLETPEMFAATIAGLGLTGVIIWAEIQLIPIKSCQIDSSAVRFDNSMSTASRGLTVWPKVRKPVVAYFLWVIMRNMVLKLSKSAASCSCRSHLRFR
jgi:FAD/FMN-containing dehydrogenase